MVRTNNMELKEIIFSSWILLIIPGLALLCLNWWFILGSISMYITLNPFGQEYLDYKKNVGRVFLKIL